MYNFSDVRHENSKNLQHIELLTAENPPFLNVNKRTSAIKNLTSGQFKYGGAH